MSNKIASPVALEGWLEFNRIKWNVRPIRMRFSAQGEEYPSIDAVFYLDRKGRIRFTPISPYAAISFNPKPSDVPYQGFSQWLNTSHYLIDEMHQRGLANTIQLPPEIPDVRPWQWAGFKVGVSYTFYIDLPCNPKRQTKGFVKKAEKAGYRCCQTTEMAHVASCLNAAESRKGFSYQLTTKDLELARDLLGDEHLRAYVGYSPDGEPASTLVVLHAPGTRAIGLVAGTLAQHLSSGTNQLTVKYALDDLDISGAEGFDYFGANIPNVAEAKSKWGSKLVPYYFIESFNARKAAKWVMDWQSFRTARKESAKR